MFVQIITLLLPTDISSNTMFDLLDYFQYFSIVTNMSMNILRKFLLHT